jgi:hypothetical protein
MSSGMTDEIAFKLGKFDFPAFYSMAYYQDELKDFFDWTPGWSDSVKLVGSLKRECFTKDSHKLNFIRGRLQSYSVFISDEEIKICWANSYDLRDIFADFTEEIVRHKWGPMNFQKEKFGLKFEIIRSETLGTVPGTPYVRVIADKEIINYILGK